MTGRIDTNGTAARLRRPVISVGNIAMGGRGKTPLVAHVTRLLVEAGERPAILSRGYGRRRAEEGVVIVSDGTHVLADVDRAGDEPLMLARRVPGAAVLVCDQRAMAGALAERVLDATVHVLDDGFQHRSVARDIDLVVVSPRDLEDCRMPFGRLREPASALERADAIVWDEAAEAMSLEVAGPGPQGPEDRLSRAPGLGRQAEFFLSRTLGDPVPLEPERGWPGTGAGVIAVAGIANPKRFVAALDSRGIHVSYVIEFPDHHVYSARDVEHIARSMDEWGAASVLTTEKDATRLLPRRPLPVPIAAVPLDVQVEDARAFREWLFARLREHRP
jgi:tetraacyldisaccharide 4'-kinase